MPSAGNRLTASYLSLLESKVNNPRIPLINNVGTAGTAAVGTAETVVITFPAATFTAHTAYAIDFQGMLRATAANVPIINFRDTNIAGTTRGGPQGFNLPTAINLSYRFTHYIANTTGADIVGRVLCVTIATNTSTALINASALAPYSFVVTAIGSDTDWSQAVAL